MTKTALAASILIKPVNDMRGFSVLNDLASHAVEAGLLVGLGDFHSVEENLIFCETCDRDISADELGAELWETE